MSHGFIFVASAVTAVCLLLAGCGGNSTKGPFANTIGSDIDAEGAESRVQLLETYFGLMCGRAGVSFSRRGQDAVRCNYSNLEAADWREVVRASMNDVDERCDRYLETVHSAGKNRTALTNQLTATESTTNTILGLDRGILRRISKKTITIVGKAFGFANASLKNYYSRLILEVNKGSLRGLVKKRQTAYRIKLEGQYMEYVVDKPSAYYAMRGYLRLCTPVSIESEIKATIADLKYRSKTAQRGSDGNDQDPDLEFLAALPR